MNRFSFNIAWCMAFFIFPFFESFSKTYLLVNSDFSDSEKGQKFLDEKKWNLITDDGGWNIYQSESADSFFYAAGLVRLKSSVRVVIYNLSSLTSTVVQSGRKMDEIRIEKRVPKPEGSAVLSLHESTEEVVLVKVLNRLNKKFFPVLEPHLEMILVANDMSYLNLPGIEAELVDFELPPVKITGSVSEFIDKSP